MINVVRRFTGCILAALVLLSVPVYAEYRLMGPEDFWRIVAPMPGAVLSMMLWVGAMIAALLIATLIIRVTTR